MAGTRPRPFGDLFYVFGIGIDDKVLLAFLRTRCLEDDQAKCRNGLQSLFRERSETDLFDPGFRSGDTLAFIKHFRIPLQLNV